MKYVAFLIAGLALAGCDITFGQDGPVITQTDSVISRVVPIGTRQPATATETTTIAREPQTASTRVRGDESSENTRGVAVNLADLRSRTALPVGIRRSQVESFMSAVADEGCLITSRQQRDTVQNRAGLDDNDLGKVIDYVWRTGELDRNSGSYKLTSGRCSDV